MTCWYTATRATPEDVRRHPLPLLTYIPRTAPACLRFLLCLRAGRAGDAVIAVSRAAAGGGRVGKGARHFPFGQGRQSGNARNASAGWRVVYMFRAIIHWCIASYPVQFVAIRGECKEVSPMPKVAASSARTTRAGAESRLSSRRLFIPVCKHFANCANANGILYRHLCPC